MGNETEREAFEQLVRETCHTDEYTFKRDGGAYFRTTYAKTYDGLPPREMASVQTLWNFYQAGAAYQRAQPSDDVAKDAARWDMLVKIYDHVLTHPDSRKHDAEYGRYKTAIEAGLGITGAIDAAMAGGGV